MLCRSVSESISTPRFLMHDLETFDMTHSTSRRQMLSQGAALVGAASTGLLLPQSVLAQSGKIRVGLSVALGNVLACVVGGLALWGLL